MPKLGEPSTSQQSFGDGPERVNIGILCFIATLLQYYYPKTICPSIGLKMRHCSGGWTSLYHPNGELVYKHRIPKGYCGRRSSLVQQEATFGWLFAFRPSWGTDASKFGC